ncbi:MAG: hypothetical protein ABIH45_00560 [Candidatus Omnitrophota bacterium]
MRRQGVVLISVMIVFLTIAVIGATLVAFFSSVDITARSFADETKALYLAEAGIAYAINLLHYQTGSHEELAKVKGPFELGEGTYSVEINNLQSLIISTGKISGVTKTIQLQYRAL